MIEHGLLVVSKGSYLVPQRQSVEIAQRFLAFVYLRQLLMKL